jgi:signal transduction histidine kinase
LEIIIEDNGRGFTPASATNGGNGLVNLHNRLAAIGGQCRVESQPGQGTRVHLQIELPGLAAPQAKAAKTATTSAPPS